MIKSNNISDSEFHEFHANETYDIILPFVNPICTEDEIDVIICNLSNSKAKDIYGISNHFLKLHKNQLKKQLTLLINQCLTTGIFPDSLKLGLVSPIHKSGSKTERSNYRPITILPVVSKILESVILRRLDDHFNANKILNPNQFGYTKSSNTEIAALHILNDIYLSLDARRATALTCLDLSRAFDCVQHTILLNKLRKTRLSPSFYKLLTSYFANRKQVVKIGDHLSSIVSVIHGVPQGGILSGFLFNFYVNSLGKQNLDSSTFIYCDDISVVTSTTDPQLLKTQLENDLAKISKWLKFHYLFPNASKTKYLLFHSKMRHESFVDVSLNIRFNNTILERVESIKLLGLTIDEVLNFSQHIKQIHSSIAPFIFALKRIRPYLTEKTALMLYFAYVQSRLLYMNVVWCAAPKYLLDSLHIIQRKALRIVYKKPWDCSKSELYSINVLPVSCLIEQTCAVLTFKITKGMVKSNIPVQYVHQIHNHSTRNNGDLVINRTRTQLAASNFFVRSFVNFNDLPLNIKNHRALGLFKSKLREYLYEVMVENLNNLS